MQWLSFSAVFDYSVAYAMVGVAGLLRNKAQLPLSVILGCTARFITHYISGVTVYARHMPEVFMDLPMTSPYIYSLLYNGEYMLPNTVIAVVVCLALAKPLQKWLFPAS